MKKELKETSELDKNHGSATENDDNEAIELVLFQVPESYVYLVIPSLSLSTYICMYVYVLCLCG